jgi:hypothetical protein
MKHEMKESLLFLDKVRKISVSYIHGNGNELSDTSSTTLSVSPEYETDVLNFTLNLAYFLFVAHLWPSFLFQRILPSLQFSMETGTMYLFQQTVLVVNMYCKRRNSCFSK